MIASHASVVLFKTNRPVVVEKNISFRTDSLVFFGLCAQGQILSLCSNVRRGRREPVSHQHQTHPRHWRDADPGLSVG